jgi:hypothetical protein
VIVVAARGNAVRVADDRNSELALLRLYGARDLDPAPLATEAPNAVQVTLIGIADPQAQAGGSKVGTIAARLGASNGAAIEPVPGLGFAGAAVLDGQGQVAGMVELKPAIVAGPPAAAQAALVSAAAIRKFLADQNIEPATGRVTIDQAKTSVVRVICVRK